MELRDLDPIIEKEEVLAEFEKAMGITEAVVTVKALRRSYSGTQTAILELPTKVAVGLHENARIKIGYVYTRVRMVPEVKRCYRCHDFGHISYNCKAVIQGRESCRRSEEDGIKEYSATVPRYSLCAAKGIKEENCRHVAGSTQCQQFKKYMSIYRKDDGRREK